MQISNVESDDGFDTATVTIDGRRYIRWGYGGAFGCGGWSEEVKPGEFFLVRDQERMAALNAAYDQWKASVRQTLKDRLHREIEKWNQSMYEEGLLSDEYMRWRRERKEALRAKDPNVRDAHNR